MGIDTKLFIATKEENILKIMPLVISALNEWQRDLMVRYAKENGFKTALQYIFRDKDSESNKMLKDFSNGIKSCRTHNFESFHVNFIVNGEHRDLFVTHTCSNDYSDIYKGEKIIFSLGCWGMSKEIMMVIAEAIKDYGDVYFVKDDCSEDFEKLEFKTISK